MAKLWSTEDLLGQDEGDILVWNHNLNRCSFKYLLRLSKRLIITSNINKVRKLPPCVAYLFRKSHKRPWRTKGKHSGGSTRKPSETRPGAMTLIDKMVYDQPGLIHQVTGYLTHSRLWSYTVFLDHYSKYCYAQLIRGKLI